MVRLGIATGSLGPNGESSGHRVLPLSDPNLYPYSLVRTEGDVHRNPQQLVITPSGNSPLQLTLDGRLETVASTETVISPVRSRNEALLPAAEISPTPSSSSSSSSNIIMSGRPHITMWSKSGRESGESVIRSQKRSYRETESPEVYEKYSKEVKWCPLCRSPVHANSVHHCPAAAQHEMSIYTRDGPPDKPIYARDGPSDKPIYARDGPSDKPNDKFIAPDHHISPQTSIQQSGNIHHSMSTPEEGLNFSGRISSLRVLMPSVSPHSISPGTSHSQAIPQEDHSPSTSNPSVLKTTAVPSTQHTDHPRSSPPPPPGSSSMSQASTSHHPSSSSERPSQSSPTWSGGNYPPSSSSSSTLPSDAWETPTSLISRLTAGLTARSSQQEDKGYRGCPSPSMSESSSVSMSSSYFSHQESSQPDDPFSMAHQELIDEFPKQTAPPVDVQRQSRTSNIREKTTTQPYKKRGRRYTSSESASSDVVLHGGDSSMYGSQDSDTEDNSSCGYLDENGKLPDLDTLLKTIKEPDLTTYSPDKASIEKFLEPHEIGHINHLIKSVSDAMLTISLPETLYKSKGFTPLDYMDIHLNCVIRHFFFVFKNEDFLNLTMADQIALLDGCTLRAIQCTSLYLFNKEAGCWHIPGATNKVNHPVIHVSDLMQVFPQAFVTRTYELHCIAAKLGFDWPMGVIASCILMYTPLKRVIQEMDKVDVLRNKYVNLLLKYITWKHGTYNASLIFPEVLKLLDALLLHVDDFSTITLKLNKEEIMAVEERLATLTLSQMAPYGCQSSKFKEKVASWSTLDCVKLGDIQNRLCRAMHMSMLDSLQSTSAHYWTSNAVYYGSGVSQEEQIITHRPLPQLMPPTDKDYSEDRTLEHNTFLRQKILHQNREMKSISALAHKDLMMLRKFLEEVTNREGTLVVQNIKERMDSNQIKKIINKLCS